MALSAKQVKDLNRACEPLNNILAGTLFNSSGSYTVTAADATANLAIIAPGVARVSGVLVEIRRSGSTVTADSTITVSGSQVRVTDGAATYAVTENDVITYSAW